MRIETDEGFVTFLADNDAEIALLASLAAAINGADRTCPALLVDNLENGTEHRIINGTMQLKVSG